MNDSLKASQTGGALLIMLSLLAAAGVAWLAVAAMGGVAITLDNDARTQAALEAARQGLIGGAVTAVDRPGSLPCPDMNNDGEAEAPNALGVCPSYLGRLPWRSLGLADLRDGSGERLWYAVSPRFRDHALAQPINSDAKGTLTVYSNTMAVTVTTEAAAVVFAPGGIVAGQNRDSTSTPMLCIATATIGMPDLCATNYLESSGTINNASVSGPYVIGDRTDSFNDQVAVLTTADFMPLVEQRIARELRALLNSYRSASTSGEGCNCFPWADSDNDGISNTGMNRGRIPLTALPHNWGSTVPASTTVIPSLPSYFAANQWDRIIYYSAGRHSLQLGGGGCSSCIDTTLTFDTVPGHQLVLISLGYARANRTDPTPLNPVWSDYINDTENTDNDDTYITAASRAPDRDRLFTVNGNTGLTCQVAAQSLAASAPCGDPSPQRMNTGCTAAAGNLAVCSCYGVVNTLFTPPCSQTLSPPQCQAAIATLNACTS